MRSGDGAETTLTLTLSLREREQFAPVFSLSLRERAGVRGNKPAPALPFVLRQFAQILENQTRRLR
ncbi:hypothetical protein KHU12_26290, partial [Pseudocitrobacter faecalis]|uniref:hypothetical protein n=1 Tax=Pseudocitrobacter faecalis TaxID=1398493 RepID=UPI00331532A9